MEGSDGSPPPSLCMIRAAELFPKPTMEKEDNELIVPFQDLAGESVKYLGRTDDGMLALSNYRLFLLKTSTNSETSVPLGLIESAQIRDLFHLLINCKDASTVKCSFETAEQCSDWARRISLSVGVPESLESLFAFPFYSWTSDSVVTTTTVPNTSNYTVPNNSTNAACPTIAAGSNSAAGSAGGILSENCEWSGRLQRCGRYEDDFRKDVERLQFDLNGAWRISHANAEFKLCPSYPQQLLVPCCISDEVLKEVANFRGSRRLPAVVWRHKQSGAVIARCSQPEVGWFGWRSPYDEQLLKALADACAFDRGEQSRRQNLFISGESTPSSPEGSHEEVVMDEVRKILIVDARSYTSAVTNRARGGGCECIEYYPCAEIEFMNLGNIHAIRKSFHAMRQLCSSPPDCPNWLSLLERTLWFQHLSGLLAASMTVCHAIEKKGRPVLVHCSDGWDRTPQIVATAQLCLDPYYRTVEGFKVLCEREWLNYGHKFADRCGHGPGSDELNERCPVFIQWLDLVHQIHEQFPCSFEFSMAYLIKLAQHSHSCLFGTFLCNTLKERIDNSVFERTFSVWPFLSGPMYRNALYVPNKEKVLWPAHNVRDLWLWTEVYLGSLGNQNSADFPPSSTENNPESKSLMTKTRSYGDLIQAGIIQNGLIRRSSDPNMTVDSHSLLDINHQHSDNNSIIDDLISERENSSPVVDIIANIIQNTTEKLQNLTNDLNRCDDDEEICKINQLNDNCATYTVKNKYNIKTNVFLEEENVHDDIDQIINCDENNTSNNSKNATNECNNDNVTNQHTNIVINNNETARNGTSLDDIINLIKKESINGGDHSTVIHKNGYSNDCVDGSSSNFSTIEDTTTASMMESIDLRDNTESTQNLWYGSVNTSTDTLVPIETSCPASKLLIEGSTCSKIDIESKPAIHNRSDNNIFTNSREEQSTQRKSSNHSILPEIHYKSSYNNGYHTNNIMDESILIMPEHQKLEISSSGKYETLINSAINSTTTTPATTAQRRRRTSSSNSKNDVISLKNINGSVSSATNSRFSTPGIRSLPLTPPAALERGTPVAISCPDGLGHALSEENIRLQQIVYENKIREDALLRELHGMRMALLKKTCPNCNNAPVDEHTTGLENIENLSTCSWEAVEDRSGPSSGASSTQPMSSSVLWVPDHAVSQCTGCQTEFWLGRRKHHCRSCGHIFCSDCSEFWTPLPDERLFKPVRVCEPCYHAVTARITEQKNRFMLNNSNNSNNQYQANLTNLNGTTSLNVNLSLSSSSSSSSSTSNNNNNNNNNNCNLMLSSGPATFTNTTTSSLGTALSQSIKAAATVTTTTTTTTTTTSTTSMDGCKHSINGGVRNDRDRPIKATTASN